MFDLRKCVVFKLTHVFTHEHLKKGIMKKNSPGRIFFRSTLHMTKQLCFVSSCRCDWKSVLKINFTWFHTY